MEQEAAPKITDVARVAGVSTATVSRALSKPETVAKQTREAVLAAAAETGYRINLAARNLRRRSTGAIVLLVPNLGNPFFSQILAGIESTLSSRGLSTLMVDTKHSGSGDEFILDYLHHSRADGIISLDGSLPPSILNSPGMAAENLPIVFGCEWLQNGHYPSVRANNEQGALLAIEHLASLGHSNIGYINGPDENVLSQVRKASTKRALKDRGVPVREDWFFAGDFTLESGASVARKWMKMEDRPSAIFCANDEIAFGLISELHQSGIRVPDQLSVIGYDDIDIAKRYIPALTTIWQPRFELGQTVAELLLKGVTDGGFGDTIQVKTLPVRLIIRQSTSAP
ncbi:MAG: LacI family DNA-binding transcriptional regulator [Rhizobiaceae bacterium]|nr:LacI family DNA-binding transcriptional regulator [Rhizobiaceae bacterium]